MIRPSLRCVAVLALCLVLAGSGPLSAKPRATVSPDSTAVSKGVPAAFWDTVWSFLVSVWPKNGSASDPYGGPKNGSSLDPFGNPSSGQGSQPDGSAGDPFGLPGH
jgi:hypothetical protein